MTRNLRILLDDKHSFSLKTTPIELQTYHYSLINNHEFLYIHCIAMKFFQSNVYFIMMIFNK